MIRQSFIRSTFILAGLLFITISCNSEITPSLQGAVTMSLRPISKKHEVYHLLKKSGLSRRCRILQCTLQNKSAVSHIYTAKPFVGIKTYNMQRLEPKMYKRGWGQHIFMNVVLGLSTSLFYFSLGTLSNPQNQNVFGGDVRPAAAVLAGISGGVMGYLLYKMITDPRKMEKRRNRLRDLLEYYILNPNQQLVIRPHHEMKFLVFCSKKSDLDKLVIPFTTERLDHNDRSTQR